jgi:hypothetical protein
MLTENQYISSLQIVVEISGLQSFQPFPRPNSPAPALSLSLAGKGNPSRLRRRKAWKFRFLQPRRDAAYPHDQVPQAEPQSTVPIAIDARYSLSHRLPPIPFSSFAVLLVYFAI